jgi:hypothetical protein
MLANFYLYPFDKALTRRGFNLVRYADDFVVMCKSEEEAKEAYELAFATLKKLGLKLHPLGGEESKTRITLYSKGFIFLGLQFQGGRVAPATKASRRFRERISSVTDPNKDVSLLKTLTTLKHIVEGWAHAYYSYDAADVFRDLDRYVREELSRYLWAHGLLGAGRLISSDQRRFFGVPSLEGIQYRLLHG